jgi:hypothetical protein
MSNLPPHQTNAPDLVTTSSTVHNPRTLAATSDPHTTQGRPLQLGGPSGPLGGGWFSLALSQWTLDFQYNLNPGPPPLTGKSFDFIHSREGSPCDENGALLLNVEWSRDQECELGASLCALRVLLVARPTAARKVTLLLVARGVRPIQPIASEAITGSLSSGPNPVCQCSHPAGLTGAHTHTHTHAAGHGERPAGGWGLLETIAFI